ncbi:MAG: 2Fe-2S iron-sulfur cluster-binding protein [Anaerolineae bacterium]
MPRITIDGQSVEVAAEATVLQAIRQVGAHLPTLCYWEGLPAYGACRLCLVEMTEPQAQVIAACAYPVEDGMSIETQGERAVVIRKMMLEFMLARCPTSDVIRSLARDAGVIESRFASTTDANELCILCGLCVRVCRDLVGAAAIGFIGRGTDRVVGAPFQIQSDACIGCAACAAVCPTGAIKIEDVDGQRVLSTWNTRVPLKPCPACDQPFAPDPMMFLRELVSVSAESWDVCPDCRRKQAAAQLGLARIATSI